MIMPPATGPWLILVSLIPIVAPQIAFCTDSQYNWMFGSQPVGKGPCYVAEQLARSCNTQVPDIPSLQVGSEYPGLTTNQTDSCTCNTIFYSMLSACAACQGVPYISWPKPFAENCTSTWSMVYPNPIPSGVVVPHWAYLDISKTGSFNVAAAKSAIGGPDSTSPAPTSTSSSTSSSQSSSSAGPIAGGVVGGVVGVALIAGVAIFYKRRGRHRSDYSNDLMSGPDVLSTSPFTASPPVPELPPQRLYDPQDPSTSPPPMYTSVPQSFSGTTYTAKPQEVHQLTPSATHYAGVPEL